MSVRIYDVLLGKYEAYGRLDGGPSREELLEIRDQEHDHVDMLSRTLGGIGADPGTLTPTAHRELRVCRGVLEVLADASTSLLEAMEAVVVLELSNHHSWETLVELAELSGYEMMADRFGDALTTKGEHVSCVREWVAVGQGRRPTRH
jgi:hypothetical protein